MSDVLKILTDALQAQQKLMVAILKEVEELRTEKQSDQWITLTAAAKELGPAFSPRKLAEDIKAGVMEHGTHYVDTSNGSKPKYAVKLSTLKKLYALPPGQRKRYS
ncbi:MAG: hypothetical protein AAF821_00020 [Cyanobacteria bacterium P01_D01_bin.156]